nr:MAG TPA: hypothetical protein [Caudoviricetes sp.]
MLKNKKEREEFLKDDSNWKIIGDLAEYGVRIYMLNFNDGTSILRFDNKTKFNEYLKRDWVTDCYKIKNSENRLYVNGRCLSYCVDYISKRELMEEK